MLCPAAFSQDEQTLAGSGSVMGILARIKECVSDVNNVSSKFHQERNLSILKEPVISKGRFYYEKPDKLRWEITDPTPSGFLVNADKARQWKGDHNDPGKSFSVRQNPVAKLIADQIFAWTKADFVWIEERYTIVVTKHNPPSLKLIPRSQKESKYIDHYIISFDFEQKYVTGVDILEKSGDSTRIRFSETVVNQHLRKGLFD